jgi:alkylation response protein AidB-like acyl-CoA dehydrogenase
MQKINEHLIPFEEYLNAFKAKLKLVFHEQGNADQMALERGLPPGVRREIMSLNPLSVAIPEAYGGRGGKMDETISLLAAASYESLALSLMLGINLGLFLQPIAKYAGEEVKQEVFGNFLHKQHMGGLMITEPGHGSDALNMQTYYTSEKGYYQLKGTKHWAGLTGLADYWLLTAREKSHSGHLKRDIDFFVSNQHMPGQQIVVEEIFENLGLYQIPYGRNFLDLKIPVRYRLDPQSSGVQMMLDMLHRNRMQFPGMAMGFIHRLLDEAIAHTQKRQVGGVKLFGFDQVQHRLASLQASFTICSAMCVKSSILNDNNKKLDADGIEVNSVKTVVTDLMQDAAQSVTQLFGAQAYKLNHIAGRGIVDSRPFQIFEGSNDLLYAQIASSAMRLMKKANETHAFRFLKQYKLTENASDYFRKMLDFKLSAELPQRKMVEFGRMLGRMVSLEMVLDLGAKGFNPTLIENGIAMLKQEISGLLGGFVIENQTEVVENYQENSSWRNFYSS